MAEKCKDPRASAQTPLGGFTVATTNLHNFHFVKTINALYGLPPPPSYKKNLVAPPPPFKSQPPISKGF